MKTLEVIDPFAHIPERNRPAPTGRTTRHGGIEYQNPAILGDRSLCIGDGVTDRLLAPEVWDKLCDRIEAAAAPDMLAVLREVREFWAGGDAPPALWAKIEAVITKAEAPATTLP